MENIYVPKYKKITQIETKFDLFRKNLRQANQVPRNDAEVMHAMNFDGDSMAFEELEQSVSLDLLAQKDDIRTVPFDPSTFVSRKRTVVEVPKKALRLNTVALLIESQGQYNEMHKSRSIKYNRYNYLRLTVDNEQSDLEALDEILLVVRIYEPFRYMENSCQERKPKLCQEFRVLGSQYLTELRDKIYCQCKFGPFYDISESGVQESSTKPFDHGFFFINDTFYNDTREPTIDYSEEIRKWASRQKKDLIGELKVDSMEQTQFKDLTIRMGYPFVYMHHGNCEHTFTISDIRLISQGDSLKRADYPILTIISSSRNMFCMICGLTEAHFLVTDTTIHIHDPAYLCQTCFESCHYVNGKKVGEFRAYRYFGNKPILNIDK